MKQQYPSGCSSTGRLVALTYGGSSAGDYFGYDNLGRDVLKIQQTGSVNYQTSATYSIAGALTSETYPSDRTISYSYDQAGRTSSVSGTLGDRDHLQRFRLTQPGTVWHRHGDLQ